MAAAPYEFLAGVRLPAPHGVVGAGRGEDAAVRREGQSVGVARPPGDLPELLPRRPIPQPNRFAQPAGDERVAVAGEPERHDRLPVAPQPPLRLTGAGGPQADQRVIAAGSQQAAVGRKSEGRDGTSAFELAERLTGRQLPEAQAAVTA